MSSSNIIKINIFQDTLTLDKRQSVEYTCSICNRTTQKQVRSINEMLLCKRCQSNVTKIKKYGSLENYREIHYGELKKHLIEKYGVENISQLNDTKLKVSNTRKSHDENFNKQVKEKSDATKIEKYGSIENYNKIVNQKIKDTLNEHFGSISDFYDYRSKKIEETCLEEYGAKSVLCTTKAIEKAKEYRKIHKEEISRKMKETKLKNNTYGSHHYRFIFDNEYFDSSWELAYFLKTKKDGFNIERNKKAYLLENGKRVIPDFIVNGQLVEIKDDHLKKDSSWKFKEKFYKDNNVKVLFFNEIKPYLKWVIETFDESFLEKYKFVRYKKCILEA